MARTRSGPLGGRPKTLRKACWYSGKAAIWAAAASRLGCPISLGLAMGSAACSSSVFTRPSQNCVLLWSALRTVGSFRWPTRPLTPIETGLPSVKARAGSWHVLQAMVPSTDKRPSKNSFWPSAIFSGVCGLSAGTAARVVSSGTPTCLRDLGSASGPAAGTEDGRASLALSQPRVSATAPPRNTAPQRTLVALVTRPRPRHEVESLERDRLSAALALPVLLRPLVKPLERSVDLGKLRRLARRVHDTQLLVRGVRPPVSRLLLERVAGCAIVARERVHHACSLLEQASLQVLPLCRGQRHTASPWEIAARRASRKHLRLASLLGVHPL